MSCLGGFFSLDADEEGAGDDLPCFLGQPAAKTTANTSVTINPILTATSKLNIRFIFYVLLKKSITCINRNALGENAHNKIESHFIRFGIEGGFADLYPEGPCFEIE